MKVYLLQDLKGKGKKGDIVEVSEGYGRNFLIPKKIAVVTDKRILAEKKSQDEAFLYHKEQEFLKAKEVAKILDGKTVEVKAKPGAGGKIFGKVTSKEVASVVSKTFNVEIDKKRLQLPEIKEFGTFEFKVKIYPEIVVKMKVSVVEQ